MIYMNQFEDIVMNISYMKDSCMKLETAIGSRESSTIVSNSEVQQCSQFHQLNSLNVYIIFNGYAQNFVWNIQELKLELVFICYIWLVAVKIFEILDEIFVQRINRILTFLKCNWIVNKILKLDLIYKCHR